MKEIKFDVKNIPKSSKENCFICSGKTTYIKKGKHGRKSCFETQALSNWFLNYEVYKH